MESKWTELLKSRKFWAALVGLVLIVAKALQPTLAIDEAQVTNVVMLLAAYIVGTGLEKKSG